MPLHPGGADFIEPYIGKCIDEPFEDQGHSKSAYKTFLSLPKVGVIGDISKV